MIRAAEEQGEIKSVRTPGKHRRFRPEDVDALKARWRAVRGRPKKGPARGPEPGRKPAVRCVDPDLMDSEESVEFDEQNATREAEMEVAREQKAAEAKAREAATLTERQRLQVFKEHGRQLVTWRFVPDEVKAEVIAALEAYVTPKQFPAWLPDVQAYGFIQARVDAVVRGYRDEEARKADEKRKAEEARAAQEKQNAEEEQAERRIDDLIEYGTRYARSGTSTWHSDDQRVALREIKDVLKEEVDADWSEADVQNLVREELADWEEDEPEW